MLFGASGRAFAHPGHSANRPLTVTAVVLTKCSVDSANSVACSEPLDVRRETSGVQTLLVDGQPRRVVVVTLHF